MLSEGFTPAEPALVRQDSRTRYGRTGLRTRAARMLSTIFRRAAGLSSTSNGDRMYGSISTDCASA